MIKDGRVTVNDILIKEPSTKVQLKGDKIKVDGKLIVRRQYEYILLNKPSGYITTRSDRFAEKTVYDLLPEKFHHLVTVGRLDKDTEGLLLFTNDGALVLKLTHPRYGVEKTYFAKIVGEVKRYNIQKLQNGIMIDGKKTFPCKIRNVDAYKDFSKFSLILKEGRKRQIRLMMEKVGNKVVHLNRYKEGPLSLGSLKLGKYRVLTESEIKMIKKV